MSTSCNYDRKVRDRGDVDLMNVNGDIVDYGCNGDVLGGGVTGKEEVDGEVRESDGVVNSTNQKHQDGLYGEWFSLGRSWLAGSWLIFVWIVAGMPQD